jgi:hypothetical protein
VLLTIVLGPEAADTIAKKSNDVLPMPAELVEGSRGSKRSASAEPEPKQTGAVQIETAAAHVLQIWTLKDNYASPFIPAGQEIVLVPNHPGYLKRPGLNSQSRSVLLLEWCVVFCVAAAQLRDVGHTDIPIRSIGGLYEYVQQSMSGLCCVSWEMLISTDSEVVGVAHRSATRESAAHARGSTVAKDEAEFKKYVLACTAYAQAHGNKCLPPEHGTIQDGYDIGKWVSKQRNRRESRTQQQLELIETIPGWAWSVKRGRPFSHSAK